MRETILLQELLRRKSRLVISLLVFFLLFYFGLPFLIWRFPSILKFDFGPFHLPWWWVYAFLQLIVTWLLGWIYWVKAKGLDEMVENIKQGYGE